MSKTLEELRSERLTASAAVVKAREELRKVQEEARVKISDAQAAEREEYTKFLAADERYMLARFAAKKEDVCPQSKK